jgi:hypothetical protein
MTLEEVLERTAHVPEVLGRSKHDRVARAAQEVMMVSLVTYRERVTRAKVDPIQDANLLQGLQRAIHRRPADAVGPQFVDECLGRERTRLARDGIDH